MAQGVTTEAFGIADSTRYREVFQASAAFTALLQSAPSGLPHGSISAAPGGDEPAMPAVPPSKFSRRCMPSSGMPG